MLRKIFFSFFLAGCLFSLAAADQVTIQADIVIQDECPDYNVWDSRALITESKKLHNDIFLYYVGQVPCALVSALSAAGAITIVTKTITGEWHPLCNLGAIGLAGACPAFAAWFIDLENKKILARYNIEEINDQLALNAHTKFFEEN